MDRVAVFIDYQNTYEGARRCFCSHAAPYQDGQFYPRALSERLAADSPYERQLDRVRIYRGRPESSKQPTAYGANRRQEAAWKAEGCEVSMRTLRYPRGWPKERAEEKGIDVQLAIDFVMMAVRGEYDVGILVSTDTDLKPALEAVCSMGSGRPRVEVAAWNSPHSQSPRLSISGRKIWCHWLHESAYNACHDSTNYAMQ